MLVPNNTTTTKLNYNQAYFQGTILSRVNDTPFAAHNLTVVKLLTKAKFPVYLAISKVNNQNYALKMFSYKQGKLHSFYLNEIRFSRLKHPNIINTIHYEHERYKVSKGETKKVSYILMEYAPYGDLFSFIVNYKQYFDDKLIRTYFRQLISGLECLHSHGVAHLDLKPENVLIGTDFNLKIADFDLSYVHGDGKILAKGARYYRGPELFKSASYDLEIKMPFALDIYGAGVILFILKSGGILPHCEDSTWDGVNYVDLFYNDNKNFWKKHCEIAGQKASFYGKSFRELVNHMMSFNQEDRWTIKKIKQSKWYNGSVYSPAGLEKKMRKILGC